MAETTAEYEASQNVWVCGEKRYTQLEKKYFEENPDVIGFQCPIIDGRKVFFSSDLPKKAMIGMPMYMAEHYSIFCSYQRYTKRSYWIKAWFKGKWSKLKRWVK